MSEENRGWCVGGEKSCYLSSSLVCMPRHSNTHELFYIYILQHEISSHCYNITDHYSQSMSSLVIFYDFKRSARGVMSDVRHWLKSILPQQKYFVAPL